MRARARSDRETVVGPNWLVIASATWLALVVIHSAAFVTISGTAWTNPLLPWFVHWALLMEGALAVAPLAALIASLVMFGATGSVRAMLALLLVSIVVALYVTSWAAFASVGQFVDLESARFWMGNPLQNLRYVREMEPRALWMTPLLIVAALLVVAGAPLTAWRASHASRAPGRVLSGAALALFGVAVVGVVGAGAWARADHIQRLDPATGTSWNARGLHSWLRRDKTGPVLHLAATALDAFRGDDDAVPADGFAIIYPPVTDIHDAVLTGAERGHRPNVVVILMESMRADRLLAVRDGRAVMPEVQALARDSRVFARTFAVATHTNYASPAVLSSQYPMRSLDYSTYPKEVRFPHRFLYDHLKRNGYQTGFFSSDDENWGGKLNYIDTTSLTRFFHAESFNGPTYRPRGSKVQGAWLALRHAGLPDDRVTVSLATQWMDSVADRPFFLYLSLQNSHSPYEFPDSFHAPFGRAGSARTAVRFNGTSRDSLRDARDAYDNSLAYDDEQLAHLFGALRARGVWDNTIIVLTSDHAEAFNEHGFGIHGNALYEEQVRIPLLIRAPGLRAAIDTTLASTVDIAPTVLSLLGLPPDPAFEGASLLEPVSDRVVYSVVQSGLADQYGMVEGRWKLFFDRGSRTFSLFDLDADPQERHNLAASHPERRDAMAARLTTWRWAHLRYYQSAALRSQFFAPRIEPCATCKATAGGSSR